MIPEYHLFGIANHRNFTDIAGTCFAGVRGAGMSLRVVRATVSKGVKREYVRLVEAYRDRAGKTQHRTVVNLGRKDLLAAHLDLAKLRRLLHGDENTDCVKREDVGAIGAWDWGPMLAAQAMWRALGLDTMLNDRAGRERRDAVGLSDRALVLAANRLVSPGSEHALAQWLESDFVCDRRGRRFIAAWRDDAERKASRTPRVRVKPQQLQQWYRTLDQLLEGKDAVERALFFRLRDLFSLQVDMVFYDLTSTYFEGGPARAWRQRSQPRRQAAQPAGARRPGHGRRLADCASRVRGQPARRQDCARCHARPGATFRAQAHRIYRRSRHGDEPE